MMKIPTIVVAVALAACSSKDERIPAQVPPPSTPNAEPTKPAEPAPTAKPAEPAPEPGDPAAKPAPEPAPTAEPAKPEPAEPAPPTEPEPTKLGDGPSEDKELLEGGHWGDAAALSRACERALARARAVKERFDTHQVEGDDTLPALDELNSQIDTIDGYASLLFNVSPVEEVRDAAEKCRVELSKFGTQVSLDRAIYDALSKVPLDGLDPTSRHFAQTALRDFRLAGVDKDDATRQRISEINEELTKLSQQFQKNVNADTRSISLDPAQLDGMPEDWKKAHPVGDDGKVTVTTDYPDLFPFLTYAHDAAARKALANASAARGYPINVEVLEKVLKLRQELAKLLGFDDYAARDLADKMAGSPEVVEKFLAEAKEASAPRLASDLQDLLARKKKLDKDATRVEVEDRFYLMALIRKERHGVDSAVVREYFPYERVRDGLLDLYGELFELTFVERDDVEAWHPSVKAYEVKQGDEVIGRFFLDMHPRTDKFKHAAMFPIQTGTSQGRLPWASLVCNFPSPADGQGLMDHKEVNTFFHEFGHLIHHLLAQESRYVSTSGINVEWDFVEAPSQLLEEWAWDPKVLARFAKNEKGKTIPAKLVKAMREADEFGKGVELARQLFYAAYSFNLHREDTDKLDLEAYTDRIYQGWSPYPRPSEDHVYCSFSHLIGYKAAYYTYQWSLAIAKDMFTRFEAKGLLNPEVAKEYRTKVLAPGGSAKAEELVRNFLGRERNLEAYREWITSK